MEMISKEKLQSLTAGQQISGIVLVKGYNIQLTKNNKEYITGSIQSGIDVPFKAWGSSSAFTKFKNEAYENVPSYIVGNVDEYGGSTSIIIESVQAVDGYTLDQFFPLKYDIEATGML